MSQSHQPRDNRLGDSRCGINDAIVVFSFVLGSGMYIGDFLLALLPSAGWYCCCCYCYFTVKDVFQFTSKFGG